MAASIKPFNSNKRLPEREANYFSKPSDVASHDGFAVSFASFVCFNRSKV
ncbi:MAG: hypothetical protein ACTS42_01105 [Candidatus Hodgkinia cicadicola]